MKIDAHSHLWGNWSLNPDYKRMDLNRIKYCQKLGIDKMCVSILGTWGMFSPTYAPSVKDFQDANRQLLNFSREHDGTILGYCYVNPRFEKESKEELKCYVQDHGFIGLKLGGACVCTDRRLFPLVELCIELNVPILHHVVHHMPWETARKPLSDSQDIAELGRRYPEAKIILAHIGGGGDWEWGIKAVKDVKNVYVDTSGSGTEIGMIEMAVKEVGADRVLFGTDLTICTGISKIEGSELTKDQKEKIYYKNMLKLLQK